jgi:hypothetical protein
VRHPHQHDLPEKAFDRALLLGGSVEGQQAKGLDALDLATFQDLHPAFTPVLLDYLQV